MSPAPCRTVLGFLIISLSAVRPEAVLPDKALYLPT